MARRFPASLLHPEEDLVLDLRPHWITLAGAAGQTVAVLAVLVLVWLVVPYRWTAVPYAVSLGIALVALAAGPGRDVVHWATNHFVLTTDRIIRRSGWLAKEWMEIPLEHVADIRFRQGIVDRLVGSGTLTVESAGRSSREVFPAVPHPDRVQRFVFDMKERNERRAGSDAAESTRESVADELLKLDRLRGAGILSDPEFEDVKAKLLRRL